MDGIELYRFGTGAELGEERLAPSVGYLARACRQIPRLDLIWIHLPDEDIRAAYSFCRNYAFLPDKARLIRERAGVIDGQGNVMPGYVLLDNGCIVGA